MRRKNARAWVLTLGLAAAGLVPWAPAFSAQPQNQVPSAQGQTNQNQVRTYLGEVVKTQNGQFALLTDKQARKGYFLDDQNDVKKYEQHQVLVTGKLDPQSKMIHVLSIKSAPAPH